MKSCFFNSQFFSDLQAKLKTLITKSGGESFQVMIQIKSIYHFYCQKHLQNQVFSEFIRCKSYVNDSSTNEVIITGVNNMERMRGANVLVVEDIVDTGRTMKVRRGVL